MMPPPRGFPDEEFESRLLQAQRHMAEAHLDAVLLTTEAEVRYFTGFLTQFWASPTRPWFVVVPAGGKPIAVIPEIGFEGMAATWIDDIHTWPAPFPDDDGVTLLSSVINALPRRFGKLGVSMGPETHIRMPVGDYERLKSRLPGFAIADASIILRRLRYIKSAAEIQKIAYVSDLTSAAFEDLPVSANLHETERDVCRRLRIDLLTKGADTSPYLIAGSGAGGYDSIIMGPTDRELEKGDVLFIDTGTTYDGYFCDFNRNFAFGYVDDVLRRAYDVVFRATEAGFAAAKPGATTSDVWQEMWDVMLAGGALGNNVGRLGHGLGMELTEFPSNTKSDGTVLEPGVVLTLEPGMEFALGKQMVHEENIVLTEDGARWLTRRAPEEIPVIK